MSAKKLYVAAVQKLASEGASDPEIALLFGVRSLSVWKFRNRHQIKSGQPVYRWDDRKNGEVIRLNAAGMTTAEIANWIHEPVGTVKKIRKRLGLKANIYQGDQEKRRLAVRRARRASAFGLPGDMLKRQVDILVALTNGPMTANGIRRMLGLPPRLKGTNIRCRTQEGKYVNLITDLERRGLVARIHDGSKGGRNRKGMFSVFALTMKAVAMMAKGGRSEEAEEPAGGTDGVRENHTSGSGGKGP